MTSSTEQPAPGASDAAAPGGKWRAAMMLRQQSALPAGTSVISCPARMGGGGLGRHLEEIVLAQQRAGRTVSRIDEATDTPAGARVRHGALLGAELRLAGALGRVSPAWRIWARSVEFDSFAAARLPAAEHLIGFNGTSLLQFRGAARGPARSLSLMSANSHMRHVIRRHAAAHRQYPIERPWATRLLERNLAEYAGAQRIFVSSRYAWESFIAEGFDERRLEFFPLTPDPRFSAERVEPAQASFDVVFTGSLTVNKGVPLLIDAVRSLAHRDLRLVLVGGWKTRGMRRFIGAAAAGDERIVIAPGDPLPALRAARLAVHPTFEDGFAYAPAEALACGVPVIVSEDTGMKELLDPGRNGLIVPTGDRDALAGAIDAAYRGEIFNG